MKAPGDDGLYTCIFAAYDMLPSGAPSVVPTISSEPSSAPSSVPSVVPSSAPYTCEDDGNLCTVNFYDTDTNTCKSEPAITCGQGEACDAFTGLCQDIQKVVPCVAVIDEWDSRDYSNKWAEFRSLYPQRPFCLLVPQIDCTGNYSSSYSGINSLALPTGFMNDTVNNPDGIDRTTVVEVTRDGTRNNPYWPAYNCGDELASDWFSECGLDILSPESITFLGLFIDTSGSMDLDVVTFAYNKFLSKLQNASITYGE